MGAQPPKKPAGMLKWSFNLPTALYRARLGWLLGHRFLLLTHYGRKTGKSRHTVLEVVRYDPVTHESAVLSAYGDRADWYQNIQAHPAVLIQTGRERYRPQQRLLNAEECYIALHIYERRYRHAFLGVMRFLGYPYDGTDQGLHVLAQRVHMVTFRPKASDVTE
jgi:deazaflavin-dependent oxidoreductase (nitroreductase family)